VLALLGSLLLLPHLGQRYYRSSHSWLLSWLARGSDRLPWRL